MTAAQQREADNIDDDRSICMKQAEHKCRKLRMGAVDFSEATEQPRHEIAFWKVALRRRKGMRVSTNMWCRKKKKANVVQDTAPMTEQDLVDALKQAKQAYAKAKKNHADSRIKFLETFSEKDRKRILRAEEQRKLGRIAKLVTGKLGSKSVTKIEIDGEECTSQAAIERTLLQVNEAKCRACEETPPLQEPLLLDFGYQGNTPATDAVLDGSYDIPDAIDPTT